MAEQLERWTGGLEFKSHPDHYLDLLSVVQSSNPPPHTCEIVNWFASCQLRFLVEHALAQQDS